MNDMIAFEIVPLPKILILLYSLDLLRDFETQIMY